MRIEVDLGKLREIDNVNVVGDCKVKDALGKVIGKVIELDRSRNVLVMEISDDAVKTRLTVSVSTSFNLVRCSRCGAWGIEHTSIEECLKALQERVTTLDTLESKSYWPIYSIPWTQPYLYIY